MRIKLDGDHPDLSALHCESSRASVIPFRTTAVRALILTLEMAGAQADGHEDVEGKGRVMLTHVASMFMVPLSLRAAALLGVPQILKDAGPDAQLTAKEIAKLIPTSTGSGDPENLDRILRVLAAHKIVKESVSPGLQKTNIVERRYGLTPVLNSLTATENGVSMVPMLHFLSDPVFFSALQHLHESVLDKNARPLEIATGLFGFEWFEKNSDKAMIFNKAMGDHSSLWMSALLQKYKGFEGLSSIVDVGGGVGQNLAMILSNNPNLRGINFDLPHVVANGVQVPRLEHVGGSFLETVPEADAVFLKWVLHNWDDESCLKILTNAARALPPNGKLIAADGVLPEISDFSVETKANLCLNVQMMGVSPGGKERTLSQFQQLAARAGFSRVDVALTVDQLTILEFYKS